MPSPRALAFPVPASGGRGATAQGVGASGNAASSGAPARAPTCWSSTSPGARSTVSWSRSVSPSGLTDGSMRPCCTARRPARASRSATISGPPPISPSSIPPILRSASNGAGHRASDVDQVVPARSTALTIGGRRAARSGRRRPLRGPDALERSHLPPRRPGSKTIELGVGHRRATPTYRSMSSRHRWRSTRAWPRDCACTTTAHVSAVATAAARSRPPPASTRIPVTDRGSTVARWADPGFFRVTRSADPSVQPRARAGLPNREVSTVAARPGWVSRLSYVISLKVRTSAVAPSASAPSCNVGASCWGGARACLPPTAWFVDSGRRRRCARRVSSSSSQRSPGRGGGTTAVEARSRQWPASLGCRVGNGPVPERGSGTQPAEYPSSVGATSERCRARSYVRPVSPRPRVRHWSRSGARLGHRCGVIPLAGGREPWAVAGDVALPGAQRRGWWHHGHRGEIAGATRVPYPRDRSESHSCTRPGYGCKRIVLGAGLDDRVVPDDVVASVPLPLRCDGSEDRCWLPVAR